MKEVSKKECAKSKVLFFDCYQTLIDVNIDKKKQEIDKKKGWESFTCLLDQRYGIIVSYSDFISLLDQRTKDYYIEKDETIYHHDLITIISEICEEDLKVHLQNEQILDLINEYRNISRGFIGLYPKVKKTLALLADNYILSIASYTQSSFTKKELKELDIEKYFSHFVFSSDIGLRKASVKFYEKCLNIVDRKPEECIMIGDNYFEDIIIPSQIGMKTIWIRNPKTVSNHSNLQISQMKTAVDLKEFDRLPELIESLS